MDRFGEAVCETWSNLHDDGERLIQRVLLLSAMFAAQQADSVETAVEATVGKLVTMQQAKPEPVAKNGERQDSERDNTAVQGKRRKRTPSVEIRGKVAAAILHKFKHPNASEAECARSAELDPPSLNRKKVWKEWRAKIERDDREGRGLGRLRRAWDDRQEEYIAYDDVEDD